MKPLVPAGPTTVVNVPPGGPGTTIKVPHPAVPGAFIDVNVPVTAKVGQAMLVPVPPEAAATLAGEQARTARMVGGTDSKRGSSEWTTGAKVAAGATGVAAVGGLAVGGFYLGEHVAEHGVDTTVDAVGDGLVDAGEAVGGFVEDAYEFAVDAVEDTGDFILDLF